MDRPTPAQKSVLWLVFFVAPLLFLFPLKRDLGSHEIRGVFYFTTQNQAPTVMTGGYALADDYGLLAFEYLVFGIMSLCLYKIAAGEQS